MKNGRNSLQQRDVHIPPEWSVADQGERNLSGARSRKIHWRVTAYLRLVKLCVLVMPTNVLT